MDFFHFLFFIILHLSGEQIVVVQGAEVDFLKRQNINKLFVFGDSYADTGNIKRGFTNSWKYPYGITFPGKPTGRFSDGRVLTDFIAQYLKVKTPVSYRVRKQLPRHHLKYGMNFAFGGTGVFNTLFQVPNMSTQINFFQNMIKNKIYTASDINNSVALLSIAGNDYTRFTATNSSFQGLPSFINEVINQTITNAIRIKGLGVKKVIITNLQPIGCLPSTTASSSFKQCNETTNKLLVNYHNTLLNQAVTKLNQQTKINTSSSSSPFIILNLYDSFMSVLKHSSTHNIKNNLEPCCIGVSKEFFCGSVDEKNVKKYLVCEKPNSSFFWDMAHPTEAGWHAVYNKLRLMNALKHIHY